MAAATTGVGAELIKVNAPDESKLDLSDEGTICTWLELSFNETRPTLFTFQEDPSIDVGFAIS